MVSAGLDERPGRLGDYVLEELVAEGGMSRVFVGRDPAGRRCAVKSHRAGVVGAREALLREMELLSGLVHPGVVRLIDDGRAVAGSWYAMELVDGGTLRDRMAGPQTEVLGQLRDVCLTLAWLHGRGIVHRDLKPENVLVRGTGAPVLADFGVVGHFAGAAGRERVDGGHGGGTVAYMAPELWAGGTVDARADLYAVGCMLYEVLAGRPPFVETDARTVWSAHLAEAPLEPGSGPTALVALTMELLAKDPAQRPGYAVDVARLITKAADLGPSPLGRHRPRPYLYAAPFVGREAECGRLEDALDEAIQGEGRVVVVQGASGSGKSRLVVELARLATARGVPVYSAACGLHGPLDGRHLTPPLHGVRPVLRGVLERCEAHGAGETARLLGPWGAVLAEHEPALRQAPAFETDRVVPRLSTEAAAQRMSTAAARTVTELARVQGAVWIVDDLHWADELTLRVLTTFARSEATPRRVLVVCTMRDEAPLEGFARLAASPRCELLALSRLDPVDVRALIGGMTARTTLPEAFVSSLLEDTGGNPFFVAELLREAVDQGQLVRLDGDWLLADVSAAERPRIGEGHSLRSLLRSRLDHLGSDDHALLAGAAVQGKRFDVGLAMVLSELPSPRCRAALSRLNARHILGPIDGDVCEFAHAGLMEEFYRRLPPDRRVQLHALAADWLARAGTVSDRVLARHYVAARRLTEGFEHARRAAHAAESAGQLHQAVELYGLVRSMRPSADTLPIDTLELARLLRCHGGVLATLGDFEHAVPVLRDAASLLGDVLPSSTSRWGVRLAGALLRQLLHRLLPRGLWALSGQASDRAHEASEVAYELTTAAFHHNRPVEMFALATQCANDAERSRIGRGGVMGLGFLGLVTGSLGLRTASDLYFERARRAADALDDPTSHFVRLESEGMFASLDLDWSRAEAAAMEGLRRAEAAGDLIATARFERSLAVVAWYSGQLRDALLRAERAHWATEAGDSLLEVGIARVIEACCRVQLADFHGARAAALRASEALDGTDGRVFQTAARCVQAVSDLHLGRLPSGVPLPDARAVLADGTASVSSFFLLHLLPHLDLSLCEQKPGPSPELLAATRRSVAGARAYGRRYKALRAASLVFASRLAAVEGQVRRAVRLARQAVAAARVGPMPFEDARARLQLWRLTGHAHHRAAAEAQLDGMGSGWAELVVRRPDASAEGR